MFRGRLRLERFDGYLDTVFVLQWFRLTGLELVFLLKFLSLMNLEAIRLCVASEICYAG